MNLTTVAATILIAALPAPGPGAPRTGAITDAVRLCAAAISPQGADGAGLTAAGWTERHLPAVPDDRIFAKDGMTVGLGMRQGVGGSCIIGYRAPPRHDLRALISALARRLPAQAVLGMLRLPGEIVILRDDQTPGGRYVTIAVEIAP